jgi:hypothetical protein
MTGHAAFEVKFCLRAVLAAVISVSPVAAEMLCRQNIHSAMAFITEVSLFMAHSTRKIREMRFLPVTGNVISWMRSKHNITIVTVLT